MNNNSDSLLPSSLSKVESNSRLTININQANLPLGPSLLPPSIIHPPVTVENKPNTCEQKNIPSTQIVDIPPPMPLPSIFSSSSNRPIGQMRSRYVLPPQLSHSPVLTTSETLPTPPIPTPSQPETSFSSMTVLPTPSFYNISDQSERVQQPSDTTSSLSAVNVTPTLAAFNAPKSTESEQQSTSSFPTMTVLPTPSYFDVSESNQPKQQEGISCDETFPRCAYEAPSAHWFYSTKNVNHGIIWWPFSLSDAQKLENAATAVNLLSATQISANAPNTAVPVRGGLYDVFLRDRVYKPCYWPANEEESGEVRRVTWLYRLVFFGFFSLNF
ncbi:unnamed protein product [Rodentolepis nana]|uniref:WWE domain-containing protein n=1 Tax=Rodentolepis nana TaxID=102285 RepID=A0A0R3TUQ6_RODNA|nr:unnamed protein product [Rodentolepis nana]